MRRRGTSSTAKAAFSVLIGLITIGESLHSQQVADVQIAPATLNLNVGDRTSVFATAYDGAGNVVPLRTLRWSSTNAQVIRIESDSATPDVATVVAIAGGSAIVEARVGGRRGVATVQVAGGPAPATAAQPPPPSGAAGAAALLQVEPASLMLLPAEAVRLTPVFLRSDGTPAAPARVTWKSLVPSVASVDAEGQVVAIAAGQALIEVSAVGGLVARVPVQVSVAKLGITRRARAAGLFPGQSDTLVVTVLEQNNRPLSPTAVQWASSDETVARVSPYGVVTALGGGRTEIIARGFLQEVRVPVEVHKAVEFLRLSPPARRDTIRIPLGGVQRFIAEAQAADGSPVPEAPISWTLADSGVVSFDPATGIATPRRVGVTRLRVSVPGGGLDTAWTLSVIAGGLQIATHRVGLGVNDRVKVNASYVDDAGQPAGVASGLRWTTSDPGVAQVDNEGNVVAVGPGSVRIVASTPWGKADTLRAFVQGELLVASNRSGTLDLYALNRQAPGSLNRLTADPGADLSPSYSPDGTQIAFVRNQDVYVMDADGSNVRAITSTPFAEDVPDWTADGRLVYGSSASGTYHVWISNADGSDARALTAGRDFNSQPAVSPDGRTIAFSSTRDGNYEIYLMNLDGTNQRNVTSSPAKETNPVWFPDGRLGYLREMRVGTARNAPVASVVMRGDAQGGMPEPITPDTYLVTDFAVGRDGALLALVVAVPVARGTPVSKVTLFPLQSGLAPIDIPTATPAEQLYTPAFRR